MPTANGYCYPCRADIFVEFSDGKRLIKFVEREVGSVIIAPTINIDVYALIKDNDILQAENKELRDRIQRMAQQDNEYIEMLRARVESMQKAVG